MKTIDARGRSCPEPVVMLHNAVREKPDDIALTVDNPTAVENCMRYAKNAGYDIEKSVSDGATTLTLRKKHG